MASAVAFLEKLGSIEADARHVVEEPSIDTATPLTVTGTA